MFRAQAEPENDWDCMQDRFLTRSREAVERARREGTGMPAEELLRRMDARIDSARRLLACRTHGG